MKIRPCFFLLLTCLQAATALSQKADQTYALSDIVARDPCILPDKATNTYYLIASARGTDVTKYGGPTVLAYASKDLVHWQSPKPIFTVPKDIWKDIPVEAIWAPELHFYRGKYYLFLTFSTSKLLPEQWPDWHPRVVRASQTLVSDSPTGPFTAFIDHGITPAGLMTLDGTLYEEDGKPYMVYAHEWVQVSNGTIEYMPLKSDLSEAIGEPKVLMRANSAPWIRASSLGQYVTDGPYLYKSKSEKLFMIWSSFSKNGYSVGTYISASGKLQGPWKHDPEMLYSGNGGHGMLFKTFDGSKLLMVIHEPNNGPPAHPKLLEIEDTGETLKVIKEFGK